MLTREKPGPARPLLLMRLRGVPAANWARGAFAAMCVLALIGFFVYPTYPTYDSFYALLWGRDLLHLHLPDFSVYRGPTEHPLAIFFGVFCSIFGQYGARLMVLGSIGSYVGLTAGSYRLGRVCFGPVVGVTAALLVLSRFFVENLAAQGYLDITYLALIVWAVALEVQRPRRGAAVLWLLAAAGLLRPDAWVASGLYWLWCAWPALRSRLARGEQPKPLGPALRLLAVAAVAPVVWAAMDAVVTGNPLFSLTSTSGLAQELERTQGLTGVVSSVWSYGVRIDKLPVLLGGLAGVPLAVWLAPRRAAAPLAALAVLLGVYLAEGAAGASVVDRYLLGAAVLLLPFCAVAVGGWAMLVPGTLLRRVWIAGAAALLVFGVATAARTLNLTNLRTTLEYHEDFHKGLAAALGDPRVKAEMRRCPLVSLPNNKLIPDARWILDSTGQHNIVARSQARADVAKGSHTLEDRIKHGSVAVYPLGSAVFFEAIVDIGDDPRDQVPLQGFHRIYASRYYGVYGNC